MNKVILLSTPIICTIIILLSFKIKQTENFSLITTTPPEWFTKKSYTTQDWLVQYYPDQVSNPECMSYSRGDPKVLNFNSSAYRFYRF